VELDRGGGASARKDESDSGGSYWLEGGDVVVPRQKDSFRLGTCNQLREIIADCPVFRHRFIRLSFLSSTCATCPDVS
jgi:hypothetical protein